MSGCWLTLKEVSLLLGTLARCVPLSGAPIVTTAPLHAHQHRHQFTEQEVVLHLA